MHVILKKHVLWPFSSKQNALRLISGTLKLDPSLLCVFHGPIHFKSVKMHLLCPFKPIGKACRNIPESTTEYELSQHIAQPIDPTLLLKQKQASGHILVCKIPAPLHSTRVAHQTAMTSCSYFVDQWTWLSLEGYYAFADCIGGLTRLLCTGCLRVAIRIGAQDHL
jgi:hypothetical protein